MVVAFWGREGKKGRQEWFTLKLLVVVLVNKRDVETESGIAVEQTNVCVVVVGDEICD